MGRDQHGLETDRAVALHKMARLATCALNGGGYLNFMGNEFGHPEWIDFPRAENGWSYSHARRLWSLRDADDLLFKCLGDFDRAMLAAVADGGVIAAHDPVLLVSDESEKILAFMRGRLVFIFNFHPSESRVDLPVMTPPGRYSLVLDTDSLLFGGQGRIAPGQTFDAAPEIVGSEQVHRIRVYLPCRTAMVLERRVKTVVFGK
jgi:1,4-alpha-glucan branching enzyme